MECVYWLMELQPVGLHSYFLQTDEQQNLHSSCMGSICFNRPGNAWGAVNQEGKKEKKERRVEIKWNIMQLWEEGFWSTYGVGFSWTCEANEMSRRSIWSEAGSRTQRPNRNYVSHRGDAQEDCLAPFVVNKSARGWVGGGAGYGPPCSYPALSSPYHGDSNMLMSWKEMTLGESVCGTHVLPQQLEDSVWFYHQCCNRFPPPWQSSLPSDFDLGIEKSTSSTLPLSTL